LFQKNVPIISVEIEKANHGFECLIDKVDISFISKEVSRANGAKNLSEAVEMFKQILKFGSRLICTWGDQGVSGIDQDGSIIHVSSKCPNKVIDSCGAGDTFTATVIGALLIKKATFKEALEAGCIVAGFKVGQRGFDNLGPVFFTDIGR
jgi:ketohexokinase